MKEKNVKALVEDNPEKGSQHTASRGIFFSEDGFSTVGMVLALLITLSLIFTSAQVYQVNSASANIQHVADAGALAAENIVAEFYILTRVCDAIVLSLSLASTLVLCLGLVALCVPATATLSESLVKAGNDILKARNNFAKKATDGLNKVQKLLPFMSAASAESVIRANSGTPMDAMYRGVAILLPIEGEIISVGALDKVETLYEEVESKEDQIKEVAEKAEDAAQRAKKIKERAFQHDCGNNPSFCMYERAAHLSNLSSNENPLYRSVETWSFAVALKRAQAYYPRRLTTEAPTDNSVESCADSALRKRFYAYAIEELASAYVHEDDTGNFDAYFPLFPKNTAEMKETSLYTEQIYPITQEESGDFTMHAWISCPGMLTHTSAGFGSISQMDGGGFTTCSLCQFSVSSLGKVAAASSSIENGFEYHYRIVAEAARDYKQAREEYSPFADEVKSLVGGLFEHAMESLKQSISYRIKAKPPGRYGAIALVVNTHSSLASQNFNSSFVAGNFTLGAQVAISASTLVSNDPEEGATVISSLLDGVSSAGSGLGLPVAQGALDVWSSILRAYTQGQEALEGGLSKALDSIPYASESGLGSWSAHALTELVKSLGLEPAELDAPKPIIVNTAHPLGVAGSSFAQGMLKVKQRYLSLESSGSGSLFTALITEAEEKALHALEEFDSEVTIASIEILGENGPSIPITIVLPPVITSGARGLISQVVGALREIESSISGVRQWE